MLTSLKEDPAEFAAQEVEEQAVILVDILQARAEETREEMPFALALSCDPHIRAGTEYHLARRMVRVGDANEAIAPLHDSQRVLHFIGRSLERADVTVADACIDAFARACVRARACACSTDVS